jgi:hypothetical protein
MNSEIEDEIDRINKQKSPILANKKLISYSIKVRFSGVR